MSEHRITTSEPFLDLVGIPDLPTTLPLNTTISCNATASGSGLDGEPISITLPTQTVTVVGEGQITPNLIDSSFSINLNTDGTGLASVAAVGEYDTIEWSVVENLPSTPEILSIDGSLTVLQSLFDETLENGELDLGGKTYALIEGEDYSGNTPETRWNGLKIQKSMTVKNGTIVFFEEKTPTLESDGIYTVPNETNDLIIFVYDNSAEEKLFRLATYPPQYLDRNTTYVVDAASFNLQSDDENPKGNMIIESSSIVGIQVTDTTLINDIKTILDEVVANENYTTRENAADGMGIMCEIYPNALHPTTISSYVENADGTIEIRLTAPVSQTVYFRKFNFFGRKTFFNYGPNDVGVFSFDENKIYYKPKSGFCSQLFVPKTFDRENSNTNHGIKATTGKSITFDNVTLIGCGRNIENGRYDGNMFYTWNSINLTLNNCVTYYGYRIATCSGSSSSLTATGCSFFSPYERGLVADGQTSLFVDRCEFKNGFYAVEPITRSNSVTLSNGVVAPAIITNSYFNFYSNHGSALSAYSGSWVNTTMRGNIFYNVPRVISFQWSQYFDAWNVSDFTGYSGLVFENNLLYTDKDPTEAESGQSTISYNGGSPYSISIELNDFIDPVNDIDDRNNNILGNSASSCKIIFLDSSGNEILQNVMVNGLTYRITGGVPHIIGKINRINGTPPNDTVNDSIIEIEENISQISSVKILLSSDNSVVVDSQSISEIKTMTNIPPIVIRNNTVMFSRDLIANEDYTRYRSVANINVSENPTASNGPMIIENNCVSGMSNRLINAPARGAATESLSTWDGRIRRLYGESISNNNIVFDYLAFIEEPFPSAANDIDVFGTRSTEPRTLETTRYLEYWDQVFDPQHPKTNEKYTNIGIQWSSYPTYNQIKNLDLTWSETYTPIEV